MKKLIAAAFVVPVVMTLAGSVLAAETTKRWLAEKSMDPKVFDYVYLGLTVHQYQGFYGGPWAAALMGAAGVPGLWVSQASSTSTVAVYTAALGAEAGLSSATFCLMTDRCTNGPHIVCPSFPPVTGACGTGRKKGGGGRNSP